MPKKPIAAIKLTNISLPAVSDEIRTLSKTVLKYNARNEATLNLLAYASPWAYMKAYDPRDILMTARSAIPTASNILTGKKF